MFGHSILSIQTDLASNRHIVKEADVHVTGRIDRGHPYQRIDSLRVARNGSIECSSAKWVISLSDFMLTLFGLLHAFK